MGFFSRLFGREERGTLNDPSVPISDANIIRFLGLESESSSGEAVSIESALGVPSVWAAVSFLSDTMASMPLQLFDKNDDGTAEQVTGDLGNILQNAVNDTCSSNQWRKYSYDRLFTGGRQYTFIERNAMGRVVNLWPLDPNNMTVKRHSGVLSYRYKDGNQAPVVYEPREIIDIAFMMHRDMINHYSPIMSHRETMGLAIAATKYGARYFNRGGVPPFAIEGPFKSPDAVSRAAADLTVAVEQAAAQNKVAMALPAGHTLKEIGANPDKAQLVELKRFLVEEIARIYGLPPTFLQDLTHGTFSNTEQQDLHLVKHNIVQRVTQAEQEYNLKLFGRRNSKRFVKFNVDGLLRGDFKTRMEGYASAIQNSVLKPNEARALENRPKDEHGDELMIQGATVPIGSMQQDKPVAANDDERMAKFYDERMAKFFASIKKGVENG